MMRGIGALVVLCASGAMAGCFLDAPPAPVPPAAVGPAPLRRLTNDEYLNALHDLFPAQTPVLPPLPTEAVIGGFDNAASAQQPSDVAVARYETIANIYAAGATTDDTAVRALVGCDWSTPALATACGAQFIAQTGRRVFRRPLTADETTRLGVKLTGWQSAVDFPAAVRLTLSAMLQAPQFIYRPEPLGAIPGDAGAQGVVPVEAYALASRLSFFLWASTPDDTLLDAAASGALATEGGVRMQAERMLADARARRALWSFHRQWLGLDLVLGSDQVYRTPDIDPGWTAQTPVSAETETELFIENTLMSGGTLHDLLLSPRAWVDGEMARVYHLPAPANPAAFTEVDLSRVERAGVLTRVAFLAGTSHSGGTSPPIRGNAVQLRLLCELPISPPPNANLSMPTATPGEGPQTTRMLFAARTAPPVCQGCHASLNGIGFGFEHYDAAGAYRTTEVGLPIDASGMLMGTDVDGPFDGAIALSAALDRSGQVHRCATQQWLRYALGRAPVDVELPLLGMWTTTFQSSGGDVRALLIDIVTSPTFRFRTVGS
jgi:hypothetical protein